MTVDLLEYILALKLIPIFAKALNYTISHVDGDIHVLVLTVFQVYRSYQICQYAVVNKTFVLIDK